MAKLQIKSKTIATFGGVFPIMDVFEHIGPCDPLYMSIA